MAKSSLNSSERNRTTQILKRQRSVRCIETGQVFLSLKEAMYYMDIKNNGIWKAINKNQKCGGYHWEYCFSKIPMGGIK